VLGARRRFKEELGLQFTGGSVTVTYLGEVFANFGVYGIVIVPALIGALLSLLSSALRRYRHYSMYLPLIAAFSMSSKAIVSSGLLTPALYTLVPMLLVYALHYIGQELLRASSP